MNKLITLIFLSAIFSFDISSIGFTYGLPKGENGVLSQSHWSGDCSANLNFQMPINTNSSINYFIEYNRFEASPFEAEYEMYLLGIGYQANHNLTEKFHFNTGISLGLSDDQYKITDDLFNDFTFDDNYMFLRINVGSTYMIFDILSIILKYNYTFTNEQYGISDLFLDLNEDIDNIAYSSLLIGLSLNIK